MSLLDPRTLRRKLHGALPYLRYTLTRRAPRIIGDDALQVATWWGPVIVHRASDSITKGLVERGVYDLDLSLAVLDAVKPGMVVLNVGANVGIYSLLAARRVGARGKVYAFEPDSRSFRLLAENSKAYPGVIEPVFAAVGNKVGTMDLWLDEAEPGDSSFARQNAAGARRESVAVLTIDQFLQEKKVSADLIIMDIQGAEPLAFEGMRETLHCDHPPMVIFECSPLYSENMGASVDSIAVLLRGAGYRMRHLRRNDLPDPDRAWSALVLDLKKRKGGYGFCNLMATKL